MDDIAAVDQKVNSLDASTKSAPLRVLKVAVPVPLSRVFDYLPPALPANPASLESSGSPYLSDYRPGMRVVVRFGPTRHIGVVVGVGPSEYPVDKLKPIVEQLDTEPVLPTDILELIQWASRYYHHPLGDALATALPVTLRKGKSAVAEHPSCYVAAADAQTRLSELGRAPAQRRLLEYLCRNPDGASAAECRLFDPGWTAAMRALIEKQLVAKVRIEYLSKPVLATHALNPQQQTAADAVIACRDEFSVSLLRGVTGSGKTEVYIEIARHVIAANRQVLVLLPEIGLTPQLVGRVRSALGCQVELLHSGLNDTERLLAWQAAATGEASVLIGTRSAIFAPLPNLGLVVVDEEHDGSLKQQDGFRYHARDLALVRARRSGVPIVLGSATPSLESLYNVDRGQYRMLVLDKRAGAAIDPQIALLDIRRGGLKHGLSENLIETMEQVLARGEQVIVFINRRGFAPVLMCELCTTVTDCDHCDAHLTVHVRSARLRCHHCGAERPLPSVCQVCEGESLIHVGVGTERVDEYLSEIFPDYRLLRIDRDSTARKGELERKLAIAASGEAQILIGTQMLAKGHDFPNVTLVGILDADQGLFGADFRSVEQMGQLIVQVAGRAGRAEKPGRVLIQTRNPDNELLVDLLSHGYPHFSSQLLDERRLAQWPPFVHMALLRADADRADSAREFLDSIRLMLLRQPVAPEVNILGPAHAPMERRAGRYRAQLLLTAQARRPLHLLLGWLRPALETLPAARRVRWSLDIDPHDML